MSRFIKPLEISLLALLIIANLVTLYVYNQERFNDEIKLDELSCEEKQNELTDLILEEYLQMSTLYTASAEAAIDQQGQYSYTSLMLDYICNCPQQPNKPYQALLQTP